MEHTPHDQQPQTDHHPKPKPGKGLTTPHAVIIAGIVIALAIVWTSGSKNSAGAPAPQDAPQQEIVQIREAEAADHIFGDPSAPITIVEYSDYECPFCGRLHPTLEEIVETNTDVKWVYRHLPLTQIHSRAMAASVASECVAELGGNDAFWSFSNTLFTDGGSLTPALFEDTATGLGIALDDFQSCLTHEDIVGLVQEDVDEAVAAGGRGTPFSVLITPSGEQIPFSGALPLETVQQLVDQARG